jgi:hypothetical protein
MADPVPITSSVSASRSQPQTDTLPGPDAGHVPQPLGFGGIGPASLSASGRGTVRASGSTPVASWHPDTRSNIPMAATVPRTPPVFT